LSPTPIPTSSESPTSNPTMNPSSNPTSIPTTQPTKQPTTQPTTQQCDQGRYRWDFGGDTYCMSCPKGKYSAAVEQSSCSRCRHRQCDAATGE
jgi:hypothetical protein